MSVKRNSTIRVRLAQMDVVPGRPADNTETMLKAVAEARRDGVALLVFPEMSIPGYLIGDAWEREAFLRECEACGQAIREASDRIVVVFGNVGLDWDKHNEDGRVRKYNACFVAEDRRFMGPGNGPYAFVPKTLLPNYREFDDSRYFYDTRRLAEERGVPLGSLLKPVETRNLSLACVLCEDAWDADYAVSPLAVLADQSFDLAVNISCSPFTVNKNGKRNRVFSAQAERLRRPLIYVNTVGIQNNGKTVYTFDGSSCIYDGLGHQVRLQPAFEPGCLTLDVPLNGALFGDPIDLREDGVAEIDQALVYGTRRFMEQCGVNRVTVGASGGIDSAVVAALYRRILGPDQVLLVNMPSRFNSGATIALARQLAENLECLYAEVPIEDSVRLTVRQLGDLIVSDVAGRWPQRLCLSESMLENVQARDRSSRVLAAVSCAFGGVFTCNANKAEATVGYTTLYGDLGGYLANIADLWKGEVYALGRYMNDTSFGRPVIPGGCFTVTPSAELSSAQNVDEGKGDPLIYPYHDCLFRHWVEPWQRSTPEEILDWYVAGTLERNLGYAGQVAGHFSTARAFVADLERWWNLYQGLGVAKRIQAPPILAVKRRAFGFDHRESQMGAWYSRRYQELKLALLGAAS